MPQFLDQEDKQEEAAKHRVLDSKQKQKQAIYIILTKK